MARETKAQMAERLLAEQKAQERAKKAAEKKALKVQEKSEPQTVVVDFSTDVKIILENLTENLAKMIAMASVVKTQSTHNDYDAVIPPFLREATFPQVKKEISATTVSLTKIRETINEKAGENKTTAIVKLLGEFGASSASTLLEEHYDNFFEALQKL